MIADLSLRSRRDEARDAVMAATAGMAHAQLLVRQEVPSCPDASTRWDRDRVLEHIDLADAVSWERPGDVLVIRRRGDYTRRIVLAEFGDDGAAVACDPCGLPGDRPHQVHPSPAAVQLATVHDELHHGGARTARAVPAEQAEAWEVDDAEGKVIYLGKDLVLADELYHLLPRGAHLIPLGGRAEVAGTEPVAGPVAGPVMEVAGWRLTTEQLREMRAWAAECPWRDYEPDELLTPDVVPDDVVVEGVERHYRGSQGDGVVGFLLDGGDLARADVQALWTPCAEADEGVAP